MKTGHQFTGESNNRHEVYSLYVHRPDPEGLWEARIIVYQLSGYRVRGVRPGTETYTTGRMIESDMERFVLALGTWARSPAIGIIFDTILSKIRTEKGIASPVYWSSDPVDKEWRLL